MEKFSARIESWEALADQDGAFRDVGDVRAGRSASVREVGDEGVLQANGSALELSFVDEVLRAFTQIEFDADVRNADGNGILPRSHAQRSFDALLAVFSAAIGEGPTAGPVCVNVVVDQRTYEAAAVRAAGGSPAPPDPESYRDYRCHTLDGRPVSPDEVFAESVVGTIRRVVFDSAGVVIDLGRKRRFAGSARDALLLQSQHCDSPAAPFVAWTRRAITSSSTRGGETNPDNGGLAWAPQPVEEPGFKVRRDADGRWHTYRPDGTEIGRPPD
ncbi:MAG: hypothetical protein R2715_09490 [Ilumatobacteraceae bacterium]